MKLRFRKLFIHFFAFLFLILFSTGCSPVSADIGSWQKNASVVPTHQTDFASDSFKQSMRNLKAMNANGVTLIIPYYQDTIRSSEIYRGYNTPTDESLRAGIAYARSIGLNVTLKMHLEVSDWTWRAHITPNDRTSWFNNYQRVLNHYAQIAEDTGSSQMIIGAELYNVASPVKNSKNTQEWENLIAGVRSIYRGPLTYSANHGGPAEFKELQFWDELEYIGISGYSPIGLSSNKPTVDDLINSWKKIEATHIRPIHEKYKKDILFTEIGYRNTDDASSQPFNWRLNNGIDNDEQVRLYEAFVTFWKTIPYMKGLHIWDWETDPNAGKGSVGYTVQNKPAEKVLTELFKPGSGTPTPLPTATLTPAPANIKTSVILSPGNTAPVQTPLQITLRAYVLPILKNPYQLEKRFVSKNYR